MRSQFAGKAAKIGLAMVAVLLSLGAAEAGLRLRRGPATDMVAGVHRKSKDSVLVYELVPGARGERDGAPIVINSAGFRDDEFPAPPPDGMRIVVLGDSVAWGWGVAMEDAYPQVLEGEIRALGAAPFASSIVYNLAVDGYSTEQEVRLLEKAGLAYKPDLVIVSYVLNDPDNADGGLGACFVPRIELFDLAKRAIRRLYESYEGYPEDYHRRVHLRNLREINDNFRRLGEISRDHDVPIVVAVCPAFRYQPPYPWQDLHDLVHKECDENGLRFLDLLPSFDGLDCQEYGIDIWHPSAKGHAVIARTLRDYIRAMVDPR